MKKGLSLVVICVLTFILLFGASNNFQRHKPEDVLTAGIILYILSLVSVVFFARYYAARHNSRYAGRLVVADDTPIKQHTNVDTFPFFLSALGGRYSYTDWEGKNQHSEVFPNYDSAVQSYSKMVMYKPDQHENMLAMLEFRKDENYERGFREACDLAEMLDGCSTHPYRLGDAILCKTNRLKKDKMRPNPYFQRNTQNQSK